ncbi:ankyrin repeat-containing domain protein [Rhexocercosporidium sp. MPI-PUGE-AT-0058]|nr:ankyrin repeat-containing domain protein [Rhexocercosporidium sp. MPI-PUGE-AT-0058]
MLIEAGADVTTGSPMHWAARRDWAGVIEALWERGVDIDAPSSSNPAITRARNYDIDTDNVIDRGGITPLHIATYYSSLRAARSLITHGATVSLSTQASELALAEAISNTCIPMVDLLLSSGISLENAVDSQGGTPLMAAVGVDVVEVLLRAGAMCHEGVEREMGRCSFEVRELLDSWFGSPGRGGRSGFVDEDEESLMSQETERPRPGDGHYDRRVARYTRRPSPEFTRSSARDASPDPSFDRMSTDFDFESSLDSLSLSEWNPNHDRRLVKRPIERYERPDFRSQKMYGGGSLFSEDWGEGFDERFGDEWGSGRSGFSSERDRRRSRGSGRGRVTSVSFTVYG